MRYFSCICIDLHATIAYNNSIDGYAGDRGEYGIVRVLENLGKREKDFEGF